MANEVSNYGVTLTKGGSALGELVSIDFPEIKNPAVEITHHGSNYREYVAGGLIEVAEFKMTLNHVQTAVSGLLNDLQADASAEYIVTFPLSTPVTWTFDAYVTSYKPLAADAQAPEGAKVEVTFRPTGTATLD